MPLTRQYLRYELDSSFGIVCSRKTGSLLVRQTSKGSDRLLGIAPALEHVIIWDIKTGQELGILHGEQHEVTSLCLHQQTSMLATGYEDGSIKLWDVESRDCHVTLSGHKSAVTCLAFDVSGTKLVSGGNDTDVIVWDIVNECGLYRLKGHKGPVTCCQFMEKWNVLITCSKDTLVKLWDLDTQHCFQTIVDHRSEVWSCALIRNECRLVTLSSDVELRIYEINSADNESVCVPISCLLLGHLKRQSRSRPLCLRVDKECVNVVVMSSDVSIEVYNVQSQEEIERKKKKRIKNLKKKAKNSGNEWVESGVEFALEDELSFVHTFNSSNKMKSCDFIRNSDGTIKLLISLHANMLELHSLSLSTSNSTLLHSIGLQGHRSDIRTVCISSDGNLIASGSSGMIKIWRTSTRKCLHTLPSAHIVSSCFIPGDRHVLAGTKCGDVLLYDVLSGHLLETLQAHSGPVWSVGMAPDRRGFVTGSADHDLKFWEFELTSDEDNPGRKRLTAVHVKTLKMAEDILYLKHSPNNKLLAVALLDCTVKLFFVDTLKFFLSLYGHKLPVLCMDISHDSTLLITGSADKNIRIWGLDFGDCHRSIFAHDNSIMSIQFIPNTHLCFTTSKDKTIRYWDIDNYELIQTLKGHQSEIWTSTVSSDGNTLVTGSHDLSLRIWVCTREPLVLSEEQENEREMEFESAIAEGERPVIPGEQSQNEVEMAGKKTIGSMKSAERILEALEIWREETSKTMEYEQECKLTGKELPLPAVHPVLNALGNCKPEKYVLNVIKQIKSNDLEEALIVLPFSDMTDLLKLCDMWAGNGWEVELTCRCVLFLLRVHYHQITSSKLLLPIIQSLRQNVPTCIESLRDMYGFNLAGLRHIQREQLPVAAGGNTQFIDISSNQSKSTKTKKRVRH